MSHESVTGGPGMGGPGMGGSGVGGTVSGPAGVRDYAALRAGLVEATRGVTDRQELMTKAVELMWDAIGGSGVSWLGFYTIDAANDQQMVLAAREPKAACSPIGLNGACGRAFIEKRALVVGDVASLGDAYIACDPLDRSELVVPMFDADGVAWGVLDLDSYAVDAFDAMDVAGLRDSMIAVGLSHALDEGMSVLFL